MFLELKAAARYWILIYCSRLYDATFSETVMLPSCVHGCSQRSDYAKSNWRENSYFLNKLFYHQHLSLFFGCLFRRVPTSHDWCRKRSCCWHSEKETGWGCIDCQDDLLVRNRQLLFSQLEIYDIVKPDLL